MISSIHHNDPLRSAPEAKAAANRRPAAASGAGERLETRGVAELRDKLAAEPLVRPEVVALGRALAAAPAYPSADIARRLAELMVDQDRNPRMD